MSIYFKALWAVFWKDVRLEMRSKDFIVSILVFSLLVVLIFNFAIDPNPKTVKLVGPGISVSYTHLTLPTNREV